MDDNQVCIGCGEAIKVMIMKNSGWCCERCKKKSDHG